MSVLIGHPSPGVLDGMTLALRQCMQVGDVLCANSRERCLEIASEDRPQVTVIDVDLAPGEELALCEAVAQQGLRVVVVTRSDAVNHLALLEVGVRGIVLASDGLDDLMRAVRTVLDGNSYVPPHLLGTVLHELIVERRTREAAVDPMASLTPREREVLGLLGIGADHREIAARLVISPHTAKTHIHRLLGKLEVRSRVEAAALAVAHGIRPSELETAHE